MPTIRELRESKGWTQQELAEKTSLAVTTISRLETGAFKPNRATLKLLSLVFNVRVERITEVESVEAEGE